MWQSKRNNKGKKKHNSRQQSTEGYHNGSFFFFLLHNSTTSPIAFVRRHNKDIDGEDERKNPTIFTPFTWCGSTTASVLGHADQFDDRSGKQPQNDDFPFSTCSPIFAIFVAAQISWQSRTQGKPNCQQPLPHRSSKAVVSKKQDNSIICRYPSRIWLRISLIRNVLTMHRTRGVWANWWRVMRFGAKYGMPHFFFFYAQWPQVENRNSLFPLS